MPTRQQVFDWLIELFLDDHPEWHQRIETATKLEVQDAFMHWLKTHVETFKHKLN